jgi:hypothetical protein
MIWQTISLNQWFAKIGLFVDNAIIYSPFLCNMCQNRCFPQISPKILKGNFTYIAPPSYILYISPKFLIEKLRLFQEKGQILCKFFKPLINWIDGLKTPISTM